MNDENKIKVETKVTNTVGSEIYKDIKRIIKCVFFCVLILVVVLFIGVEYSDYKSGKERELANAKYEQQNLLRAKERKKEELTRRIELPINWNSSDSWRKGVRSWGNSGFIFTDNEFILNIDSSKLSREQKARIQGKKLSCYMRLSVGSYKEYISGGEDTLGINDEQQAVSDYNSGYVSSDMFLHINLRIKDADKKAENFNRWELECDDLYSSVKYNK